MILGAKLTSINLINLLINFFKSKNSSKKKSHKIQFYKKKQLAKKISPKNDFQKAKKFD